MNKITKKQMLVGTGMITLGVTVGYIWWKKEQGLDEEIKDPLQTDEEQRQSAFRKPSEDGIPSAPPLVMT